MKAITVFANYRPLRIGWCIEKNDTDALRTAVRYSTLLCGGKYNPIIPVDDEEYADNLIRTFQVDLLYAVKRTDKVGKLIDKYDYLPYPSIFKDIVIEGIEGHTTLFLDGISGMKSYFSSDKIAGTEIVKMDNCIWDEDDPLSDILLMTYGAVPAKEGETLDFWKKLKENIDLNEVTFTVDSPLPDDADSFMSLHRLFSAYLVRTRTLKNHYTSSGVYVGSVRSNEDLIQFWNIRASGANLVFYDNEHSGRLDGFVYGYYKKNIETLNIKSSPLARTAIWMNAGEAVPDLFDDKHITIHKDRAIWNGANIEPCRVMFEGSKVQAFISERENNASVTATLPHKPYYESKSQINQLLAVEFLTSNMTYNSTYTLLLPHIPKLNMVYGKRILLLNYDRIRVGKNSLGIIMEAFAPSIAFSMIDKETLVRDILNSVGVKTEVSIAGRLASRLIIQLGGLEGCRVLKISGVRDLIEKYKYDESFKRGAAVKIIGHYDEVERRMKFEKYEKLFIEARSSKKLAPLDAFTYLLQKRMIRVGLELKCSICGFKYWRMLDDVKTISSCPYCWEEHDIVGQLMDRDWSYRKSSIFELSENQEGGIPVVLLLQQFDTMDGMYDRMSFLTSVNIHTDELGTREIDMALINVLGEGNAEIAVAECKTRKEIDDKDIETLVHVAERLKTFVEDVYILLAKLAPYTVAEIRRVSEYIRKGYRFILLTETELEPYHIYADTDERYDINRTPIGLYDCYSNTMKMYFPDIDPNEELVRRLKGL